MGLTDDAGEKACRLHRIRNGQLFDLDLEILRQELAHEHWSVQHPAGAQASEAKRVVAEPVDQVSPTLVG